MVDQDVVVKKKKHYFRWILLALVVVGIVSIATPKNKDTNIYVVDKNNNSKKIKVDQGKQMLNIPVRDGKFEFRVLKVERGLTQLGGQNEFMVKNPQGQYIKVTVTIRNISKEPYMFSYSDQYLYDANENKYSGDSDSYYDTSNPSIGDNINPGNQLTYNLYFDLPKNSKPNKLEVHDSPFSGGNDIKL